MNKMSQNHHKRVAKKRFLLHQNQDEAAAKSNQLLEFQEECDAGTDHISKLPDDTLSLILSHLTLREAVRTSILSKRWRYVWSLVSKLEFDALNIVGASCNVRNFRVHNQEKLVRCVNQVLQLHRVGGIESFRLQCSLDHKYSSEIDRWLQVAFNEALQNLDIDLSNPIEIISKSLEYCYRIPDWIFEGRLPSLSLAHRRSQFSPCTVYFSSLTSLSLASIDLSQDQINIFCNCPSLQIMTLLGCILPSFLKLASRNRFLLLKHLKIIYCTLIELEICDAVGLLSFECIGTLLRQLTLQNTAKPVRICYGHLRLSITHEGPFYDFGRLVADFPEVESLMLILPRLEEDQMPLSLPVFSRLRELVLDLSLQYASDVLNFISSLLKASPCLQKLQVTEPFYKIHPFRESNWQLKTPAEWNSQHEHLKEVKLYHFEGKHTELELVLYLLQNTSALEEIKFYRNSRDYKGNDHWKKEQTSIVSRKRLCKIIWEFLSAKVGSTKVQLLVF